MSELEQMRAALTPDDLRRLGISVPLMSDFEFRGAVGRDERWSGDIHDTDDMDAYDRRGLLNVIAVLVAEPRWPSGPDARYLGLSRRPRTGAANPDWWTPERLAEQSQRMKAVWTRRRAGLAALQEKRDPGE